MVKWQILEVRGALAYLRDVSQDSQFQQNCLETGPVGGSRRRCECVKRTQTSMLKHVQSTTHTRTGQKSVPDLGRSHKPNGCGSKLDAPNGTLVNGTKK